MDYYEDQRPQACHAGCGYAAGDDGYCSDECAEDFMTTDEMRELYEVVGFMAPFVVVRRKADGQLGSLQFTHSPRLYFGWVPDEKEA